ncbi:MAG TPA: S8 family serine peptidase [Acidimicrobiia bacterium]|nr:S8 family serine peptidase [Acidimicrobiia bacterium]
MNDRVLVKLAPGASTIPEVAGKATPVFDRWVSVPVPTGDTPEEAVASLASRPGVEAATLDYLVQLAPSSAEAFDGPAASAAPNDPYYQLQWHFPPVQVEQSWSQSTGAGVVVAVLDTGISQDGEDLDCHTFVAPYNAISAKSGLVAAEDDNGHGTHVAGTVAQCTNNGLGVAGVAFDADLMPVKVLNDEGSGSSSTIARGIDWARNHGADVINLSLGFDCGTSTWPSCSSAVINDAIAAAAADDIVIVAAAGNSGQGVVAHPANHPDVMAVGAVDYERTITGYSSRGENLDVVAPGGDLSRDANSDGYGDGVLQETFLLDDWGYYLSEGTSMATPHASGAAALLRSLAPSASQIRIRDALVAAALDLGSTGCDSTYGNGLIRIRDAMEYLTGPDTISPIFPSGASLTASDVGGTHARLEWTSACDDATLTGYRIYRDGTVVKTVNVGVTTTTVDGFAPNTRYRLAVRAVDASGNLSQALTTEVGTSDTIAPVWPDGSELQVAVYGETELTLVWSPATDNVGVTGYRLALVGTGGVTTQDRTERFSGLQPGSPYTFEVLAQDTGGNWSEPLRATVRTARAFLDTADTVFYHDILWLSGNDITRGCNPPRNDRYCPDDPVTRGQMAAFLGRALGLAAWEVDVFVDDDASVFEGDIQALAASGITRGCNPPRNDRYCPDDPVTSGQMAAFLTRALASSPEH